MNIRDENSNVSKTGGKGLATSTVAMSKIPIFSRSRIPLNNQENIISDLLQKQQQQQQQLKKKEGVEKQQAKPMVENIDKDTNCFLLSEYAQEIYQYLRQLEVWKKYY